MGRLILLPLAAIALIASALLLITSVTATLAVTDVDADADPGFPADCDVIRGCRVEADRLPPDLRTPLMPPLETCGLVVTDGHVDPTAYEFWQPRSQARHEACLSAIAHGLGDWRTVAAWMTTLRFTSDGGLRLIPSGAGRYYASAGRLVGVRAQSGLPQIGPRDPRLPPETQSGPIRMTVIIAPTGQVEALSLRPARY